MNKLKFKKILFNVAFCAMACDGEIADEEIEEMKFMDKKTTYFEDVDLSDELDELIKDLKESGKSIIDELFQQLSENEFNTIQELLILEIALKIIYSDTKIKKNEVNFIRFLRGKLRVPNEIILKRFGEVNLLFEKKKYNDIEFETTFKKYSDSLTFPKLEDIEGIKFKE